MVRQLVARSRSVHVCASVVRAWREAADVSDPSVEPVGADARGASEVAYDSILEAFLDGKYQPGTRLREEALAESIGLSRTPVREALQRLRAEGLIGTSRGRGAVVLGRTDEEVSQIFELRAMLEGYAAREASERITERALDDLSELCAQMEKCLSAKGPIDATQIARLNLSFHRQIYAAAHNSYLTRILDSLIRLPIITYSYRNYTHDQTMRSFAHHRELVEALSRGRGEWAASVMHAHVYAARASFLRGRRGKPLATDREGA